ncbi:MAG: hypothetical protein M1830_010166 [Pleopsidium flavum]|nr:MAG: hypothetical protein M1830_010166 [Pleopsidium flavum]
MTLRQMLALADRQLDKCKHLKQLVSEAWPPVTGFVVLAFCRTALSPWLVFQTAKGTVKTNPLQAAIIYPLQAILVNIETVKVWSNFQWISSQPDYVGPAFKARMQGVIETLYSHNDGLSKYLPELASLVTDSSPEDDEPTSWTQSE